MSLRTCGKCQCDIVSAYTGIRAHVYFPFVTTWHPAQVIYIVSHPGPCLFCVHRNLLNTFVLRREVKIRQQGGLGNNKKCLWDSWHLAVRYGTLVHLIGSFGPDCRRPPPNADRRRQPPTAADPYKIYVRKAVRKSPKIDPLLGVSNFAPACLILRCVSNFAPACLILRLRPKNTKKHPRKHSKKPLVRRYTDP
jgi:hypothetical protein